MDACENEKTLLPELRTQVPSVEEKTFFSEKRNTQTIFTTKENFPSTTS